MAPPKGQKRQHKAQDAKGHSGGFVTIRQGLHLPDHGARALPIGQQSRRDSGAKGCKGRGGVFEGLCLALYPAARWKSPITRRIDQSLRRARNDGDFAR